VHLQRALVEALERLERDALRHSLRQPLLGAPLAPRQLELGDVCELVRDETQPLAAASGQPPVEQRASRPGDADRERRQLVRALLAHGRVLHEPPAKCLARGVDVHARARRQRQPEVVREDVHDALDAARARAPDHLHPGRGASHASGGRARGHARGAAAQQEQGGGGERQGRTETAQLNHPARWSSPRTRSTFAISRRMREVSGPSCDA